MALRHVRELPATDIESLFSNSRPSYREEAVRCCAEVNLFAEATYASPRKSVLNHVFDTEEFVANILHANDNIPPKFEQYKWFEFFARGYYDVTKGKFVFRVPKPHRIRLILNALKYKSYLPSVVLREHSCDITTGHDLIKEHQYEDLFHGDDTHGRYRGMFLSETVTQSGVRYSLVIILHVEGEPFYRTRDFLFEVKGAHAGEVMQNVEIGNVHLVDCRDGLAAFGVENGVSWNSPCATSHRILNNFDWMTKGRRCIEFRSQSVFGETPDQVYRLARYPAQIEIVFSLLFTCL